MQSREHGMAPVERGHRECARLAGRGRLRGIECVARQLQPKTKETQGIYSTGATTWVGCPILGEKVRN